MSVTILPDLLFPRPRLNLTLASPLLRLWLTASVTPAHRAPVTATLPDHKETV